MKKNFRKYQDDDKNVHYRVQENGRVIQITYDFSQISGTYIGYIFHVGDESFNLFMKYSEMFRLVAGGQNLEKVLQDSGFKEEHYEYEVY